MQDFARSENGKWTIICYNAQKCTKDITSPWSAYSEMLKCFGCQQNWRWATLALIDTQFMCAQPVYVHSKSIKHAILLWYYWVWSSQNSSIEHLDRLLWHVEYPSPCAVIVGTGALGALGDVVFCGAVTTVLNGTTRVGTRAQNLVSQVWQCMAL